MDGGQSASNSTAPLEHRDRRPARAVVMSYHPVPESTKT
jgi:hypothetical protein